MALGKLVSLGLFCTVARFGLRANLIILSAADTFKKIIILIDAFIMSSS